jgi:hypothetical protein
MLSRAASHYPPISPQMTIPAPRSRLEVMVQLHLILAGWASLGPLHPLDVFHCINARRVHARGSNRESQSCRCRGGDANGQCQRPRPRLVPYS